jgi:hypothetical protein
MDSISRKLVSHQIKSQSFHWAVFPRVIIIIILLDSWTPGLLMQLDCCCTSGVLRHALSCTVVQLHEEVINLVSLRALPWGSHCLSTNLGAAHVRDSSNDLANPFFTSPKQTAEGLVAHSFTIEFPVKSSAATVNPLFMDACDIITMFFLGQCKCCTEQMATFF